MEQTLEAWVERNLMRLNKGKRRVLHLGRNNPKYQDRFGADLLESSYGENDLGVLVDDKLTMSQQRALVGQWYPGMYSKECGQQVEGSILTRTLVPLPLEQVIIVVHRSPPLDPGEASFGVLCPVLGLSVQERKGAMGDGPSENKKDD
ncbi:rna-directed dna polymerase from mobile element jockey-like [Pitangus sulphuratus]|nr:rna-directed dna polymerase from mobile element jockey-like [Pitangus sulphuratus]